VPLRDLLAADGEPASDELALGPIAGREGDVGWQSSALAERRRLAAGAAAARSA
jgi:hypothetical protein